VRRIEARDGSRTVVPSSRSGCTRPSPPAPSRRWPSAELVAVDF